ncbi:phage terminase large subunit family protein [Ancylobacter sp. WKF20]|uniref:terminase gpA endonuclease subunit n=1 Tax=Ancylobacter sp. WKF20 TaxID=3039801 RepID=UPI00243453EA|nr:terminase gpA endonuclease subunit [Ancylobacter sp. WKF20]WGD31219.1 phage terminase large subunit family protein [Ancylobacter sp. WKF20]
MTVHAGALHLVASRLAAAIRPQPPVPFVQWLARNIVLVDGEKKGELWSAADAPYLVEPAQCLSIEHPCNLITIRKGQQTGASILGLAWCLYLADVAPDNIIYGVPGIDALQDINGKKLQPLIDAWQKKTEKRIILPSVARSGAGSTVYEKRFAGGYITLANANVAMALSMHTCRYGVKDELSKWSETANGDDPESLFFGRFTAFRRQKSYKILEISTPEIDSGDELGEAPGHCRIDRSFRRSDQRFWHIRCPECPPEDNFEFVQHEGGFHIDRKHPHKSYYVCPNCGHPISEMERVAAVRGGRYIATREGPDLHPGFHIDAFISLMMSYEAIANDKLEAEKKGEPGVKGYTNLTLALPFAMRGNAPDHQRLMERREAYAPGVIPADGLIFVAGVDVQGDGLWYEFVAFGEDRQSWDVEAGFLAGSTDDPKTGAWAALDDLHQKLWPDAHCNMRRVEAMGVDAGDGNRTTQVIEWCRRHPNAYAIKGQTGRGVPAIGQPTNKSVKKNGKPQKLRGGKVWPVGTWSLKGEFYGNLHRVGLAGGAEVDPPGYCHFHQGLGEEYFKQITAEYFDQKLVKGRFHEEWKKIRKDNHLLDARVYAMAMAELLGISRLTRDGWAALRARYAVAATSDLFAGETVRQAAGAAPSAPEAAPASAPLAQAAPKARYRPTGWKR